MRYCFSLLLLLLASTGSAQNLVPNGSFEDENICTEFIKNCAPEAWMASSLRSNYYFDEVSMAAEGQHFVGLVSGSSNGVLMRTFIRTRLLCGLRKGNQYNLSFCVRSLHPVLDSVGIYFSPNDFLLEKRFFKNISPQLWSAQRLKPARLQTIIWQKVEFLYTATGDESFLTIGNFARSDIGYNNHADFKGDYYFFIDDVKLIPADPAEILCSGVDSIRNEIYADNDRHGLQEKKMYIGRKGPEVREALRKTVIKREKLVLLIDTLIVPDVFFATASYQLSARSYSVLDSFAAKLGISVPDSIRIAGHTDSVGKYNYNIDLSRNRAAAVKQRLALRSALNPDIFRIEGYGFLFPLAPNSSAAGRQKNRRVEVLVFRSKIIVVKAED